MASLAYNAFVAALVEVLDLRDASARKSNLLNPEINRMRRSASRGAIVLLSSHFERYIYGINEEAVTFINDRAISATSLANDLRLLHSKAPLDELAEMDWLNREPKLRDFLATDGWLWGSSTNGALSHSRLLAWMKSPKPENLVRYYRYWGIADVFSAITRTRSTSRNLRLGILELVEKRNSIAHGDFNAVASKSDITRYINSAQIFCERADIQLARAIGRICNTERPW